MHPPEIAETREGRGGGRERERGGKRGGGREREREGGEGERGREREGERGREREREGERGVGKRGGEGEEEREIMFWLELEFKGHTCNGTASVLRSTQGYK